MYDWCPENELWLGITYLFDLKFLLNWIILLRSQSCFQVDLDEKEVKISHKIP